MSSELYQRFPALQGIALAHHQVQVWQAWLDCSAQELDAYGALLSADERARARRFYFDRDRSLYIICRGLLRLILGVYLEIEPSRLEFSYGKYGKPVILSTPGEDRLEFNLSHSYGLGVFAICRGNPVGIDLEALRPVTDEDRFAEQLFSAPEFAWIAAHGGAEKQAGLFKIWTCKEAFFKATGDGLTLPLDQFVVDLDSSPSARLADLDSDQHLAARWKMVTFEPAPGFQAALAVEGQDWQVDFGWLPGRA